MALKRLVPNQSGLSDIFSAVSTRKRNYIDMDLSFESKPGSGEAVTKDVEGISTQVTMRGDVYKRHDVAAVLQSVKTIVQTKKFEKPFKPFFGADLPIGLFELNNNIAAIEIATRVRRAIEAYEPRVDVVDINAVLAPDSYYVSLTVVIRIKNTNDVFTFQTQLNRLR